MSDLSDITPSEDLSNISNDVHEDLSSTDPMQMTDIKDLNLTDPPPQIPTIPEEVSQNQEDSSEERLNADSEVLENTDQSPGLGKTEKEIDDRVDSMLEKTYRHEILNGEGTTPLDSTISIIRAEAIEKINTKDDDSFSLSTQDFPIPQMIPPAKEIPISDKTDQNLNNNIIDSSESEREDPSSFDRRILSDQHFRDSHHVHGNANDSSQFENSKLFLNNQYSDHNPQYESEVSEEVQEDDKKTSPSKRSKDDPLQNVKFQKEFTDFVKQLQDIRKTTLKPPKPLEHQNPIQKTQSESIFAREDEKLKELVKKHQEEQNKLKRASKPKKVLPASERIIELSEVKPKKDPSKNQEKLKKTPVQKPKEMNKNMEDIWGKEVFERLYEISLGDLKTQNQKVEKPSEEKSKKDKKKKSNDENSFLKRVDEKIQQSSHPKPVPHEEKRPITIIKWSSLPPQEEEKKKYPEFKFRKETDNNKLYEENFETRIEEIEKKRQEKLKKIG